MITAKINNPNISASVQSPTVSASVEEVARILSYAPLSDKPQINGVELNGNKSLSDIGAIALPNYPEENEVLRYIEGNWEASAENESIYWMDEELSSELIEYLYQHIKNGQTGQQLGFFDRTNNRCYAFATRLSATKHSFYCLGTGGRIYVAVCENDVWTKTYIDIPRLTTATPSALGTAAVGTGSRSAREDHVHAMPTAADVGAVALNQGIENAGKILVVGNDGNVTAVSLSEINTIL